MNKQPLLIQDAYDFAPLSPKPRETPWEKLYRLFFGDDIFISYARADASRYVPGLAACLAAKRHICFFDQLAADPSEGLPERLKKKILRSTVFVLVGTEGAVTSSFVRKEIELFRRTRRPFIPVDVDGALAEQGGWRDILGVAKIHEQGTRVRDGDPSPEVINLIKDSFHYTRRSQWLRASLLAGIIVIFITAAGSLLVIRAARDEAVAIRRQADSEVTAANKKVGEAQRNLQDITAEANRLKADADDARNRAESAAEAAEVAAGLKEEAEQSMHKAQELEHQAAERAAETERLEAGSRAARLAREPGMEVDALSLAVEAAEQSIVRKGDIPDEVMNGITASASAADYSLPLEDVGDGLIWAQISPDGKKIFGLVSELPFGSYKQSFEWVLWNGQTGDVMILTLHSGEVRHASFSRDGKRLAVVSDADDTPGTDLSVWDLSSPQPRVLDTACGHHLRHSDAALDGNGSHLIIHRPESRVPLKLTICEIATGREEALPGAELLEYFARVGFTPEDEPAVYTALAGPDPHSFKEVVYFPRSGKTVAIKVPGVKFAGFGLDGSFLTISLDKDTGVAGSVNGKALTGFYADSPATGTWRQDTGLPVPPERGTLGRAEALLVALDAHEAEGRQLGHARPLHLPGGRMPRGRHRPHHRGPSSKGGRRRNSWRRPE